MVHNTCHSLQQDLYKANPPEVSTITLGYQNLLRPFTLAGEGPITERCLHDGKYLQPMSDVWIFLLHCLLEPQVELFRPHAQQAPRLVQA